MPGQEPPWPHIRSDAPRIVTLAALGYVFAQRTALLLQVTLITMAIGLGYWLVVILPQRDRAWNLLDAAPTTATTAARDTAAGDPEA